MADLKVGATSSQRATSQRATSSQRAISSHRVFGLLLRAFPAEFRERFGAGMVADFADERRHAGQSGRAGVVRLWAATIAGVLRAAPRAHWDLLRQDVRFAWRLMARTPALTAAAVLVLAIGVGVNTAIFGFAQALLLGPLDVPEPDRVVRLYAFDAARGRLDVFSYPNFADLRARTAAFEDLAAHQYTPVVAGPADEDLRAEVVTGSYFTMLRVRPWIGRTLTMQDDSVPGASPVVVISHRLWSRLFGSSGAVLGQTLRVNGRAMTVVGVAPPTFQGTFGAFATDLWAPMSMQEDIRPRGLPLTRRGWGWLNGTGRLAPGMTIERARADVDRIARQLEAEHTGNRGLRFTVLPATALPEAMQELARLMLAFFGALGALLLVAAWANLASMLLSRFVARRREVAVRRALGADSGRLARQWITEALLVAAAGAAAGLLVARWTQAALVTLTTRAGAEAASFAPDVGFNARVLGFALLLALGSALVVGFGPAARAVRVQAAAALREEPGISSLGRRRTRLQAAFVVAQIAVSLVLLVTAGLVVRGLRESSAFDPGFDTHNLTLASVNLTALKYDGPAAARFHEQLRPRLRDLPGRPSAALAIIVPLGGSVERRAFKIPGHAPDPDKTYISLDTNIVTSDYFRLMGIPIVKGREFLAAEDTPGGPPAVVVNETMARRFWPHRDPIGQRFAFSGGLEVEVVGVARDIKYYALGEPPVPYVYAAAGALSPREFIVHLRSSGPATDAVAALRERVREIDPRVTLRNVATFEALRSEQLFPQFALGVVASVAGLAGLVLAIGGLYGLVSYSVAERTHEIGVRMAIGAASGDVLALMLRQSLWLVAAGTVIGAIVARGASGFLASQLFGVSAGDPIAFGAAAAVLSIAALAASYLPARRACRIDPIRALRM